MLLLLEDFLQLLTNSCEMLQASGQHVGLIFWNNWYFWLMRCKGWCLTYQLGHLQVSWTWKKLIITSQNMRILFPKAKPIHTLSPTSKDTLDVHGPWCSQQCSISICSVPFIITRRLWPVPITLGSYWTIHEERVSCAGCHWRWCFLQSCYVSNAFENKRNCL